ncbi:tripartite tricarboxylate transporter substrate binding protein [Bordetella bronchiseptica]|uniref:tripartite tricarboxylate transporter substrate binding protein n=1 Tax=Bordetella bronchiseptica TaxID=518 RepID=UPI000460EC3E|nr:tripartite tricarboxylate transporter substrate binding protein [Bordetella bronchiseptica]KDD16447.1 tripartite tricarboxylate transporter family receptor [Bordetella bronchiseptica MBORD707]
MKPFSLLRRIATIALLMAASSAHADTFPSRPIRLIVPFGPGGITDLIARQAALGMAEKLGQPVIIENKPSAGHIVAMQTVAQAAPDGYTILLGSNTGFTVAPHMYKNLPFRIDTLQPIAPINTAPTVLLARPDFPANNLTELIQYIKDNPGKLNYGSFGIGTSAHLGMEIMKSDLGLNIMHIPYRGDAQGLLALKAKEVDIAYITLFSAQARIRAGEFKALGVLQNDRLTAFPDIQTTVEVGSKNSGMPVWIAFFAPPGTPDAVMRKLESATRSASSAPKFVEFLHNNGVEPWNPSNQDLMRFIQDQLSRSGPIIQEIGLQPQ